MKQCGCQIPFTCVGENGHDEFSIVFRSLGHPQSRPHSSSRRDARKNAFLPGKLLSDALGIFVGNLDHLQTGQLMVRTTSDVNQVQTIVQMSLRILTRAPLWMIGSIVMLILTSWQLALLMLALTPLIWGLIWIIGAKAQPLFLGVQKKLDKLNQVLQENLAGVRVVKASYAQSMKIHALMVRTST